MPLGDQVDQTADEFNVVGNAATSPVPASIWPAIYPRLVALIGDHQSTMIFVNSRRLAERLAASINETAEQDLARAHHGSMSKDTRSEVEDRLKRGDLRAIVATSSMELGIDMGAVDLVIQVEAPPSIFLRAPTHRPRRTQRGGSFKRHRFSQVSRRSAFGGSSCAADAERTG